MYNTRQSKKTSALASPTIDVSQVHSTGAVGLTNVQLAEICKRKDLRIGRSKEERLELVYREYTESKFTYEHSEAYASQPDEILEAEFGEFHEAVQMSSYEYAAQKKRCLARSKADRLASDKEKMKKARLEAERLHWVSVEENWPQVPAPHIVQKFSDSHFNATCVSNPKICAVCSRERFGVDMREATLTDTGCAEFDPALLKLESPSLTRSLVNDFSNSNPLLDGLVIDLDGVTQLEDGNVMLQICGECYGPLTSEKQKLPPMSLRNDLYRGKLPAEFADLTWIEEMACALHRTTAHVVRLYGSADPKNPYKMFGNTCAHQMNVVSTSKVLPRVPADILGMVSVVFVGAKKPSKKDLLDVLQIRKDRVLAFLKWLSFHNPLYRDVKISHENLKEYPDKDHEDYGTLPGVDESVILDDVTPPKETFQEETAGIQEHPADVFMLPDNEVSASSYRRENDDSKCRAQFSRDKCWFQRSRHDYSTRKRSGRRIRQSKSFPGNVSDALALRDWRFDVKRSTKLGFRKQAEYYLDLKDRSFRYHKYYIFVVVNILQRRTGHLHAKLTVDKRHFREVVDKLSHFSPELIASVAGHMEREKKESTLNREQKEVMNVLKRLNTVAARVPGSQASKIYERNCIKSYMGYFGIPPLFLTMNPNPAHAPLFQVMFGDKDIDLAAQFPELAPGSERAIRLARDPVAAADFFNLSINLFLEHLGGWDFNNRRSKETGGIFGHIRSFYGTCECTERGKIHGHFVIWLVGAMNPSQVHDRFEKDQDFKGRFFEFFEYLIHHHLPDVDAGMDINAEPCTERPPFPINVDYKDPVMQEQIHRVGKAYQEHECKKVCFKYGSTECRFLFPHEYVEVSWYDPDKRAIYLKCLDPNVNYFNPIILVFCRHNHDLKCILSGEAARSAMFYITDYITKMDLATYEMLSLMSTVVAANPPNAAISSNQSRAKLLLQKLLAQYSGRQQIHAQQAVRYICGLGDSISSHNVVAMLSSVALVYAVTTHKGTAKESHYSSLNDDESETDDNNGDYNDVEPLHLSLQRDETSRVMETNQVDDYLCRSEQLADVCFYDFVRCFKKVKKADSAVSTRSLRFGLEEAHKQSETHELSQTRKVDAKFDSGETVPRVIGTSIPRKSSQRYPLFALTHFKPWSSTNPISTKPTLEEEFGSYQFAPQHQQIMQNWDDLYECQDERDAERIRRKEAQMKRAGSKNKAMWNPQSTDKTVNDAALENLSGESRAAMPDSLEAVSISSILREADWYNHCETEQQQGAHFKLPSKALHGLLKHWSKQVAEQEILIQRKRRGQFESRDKSREEVVQNTLLASSIDTKMDSNDATPDPNSVPETKAPNLGSNIKDVSSLLDEYIVKFSLNAKQQIMFRIVAKRFLESIASTKAGEKPKPLRALMTGPGGTGKTHVINALQALMAEFRCAHQIRFLAPTGSAASLINGLTIHSGLGIQITAKGNRREGDDHENYSVEISVTKKEELRAEWKEVNFLLVDEISLLGAELLCDLDRALRYAKECDEPFGGIHIIFSGDLCQYPPVKATPIYTPITSKPVRMTKSLLQKRLGRIAWKLIDVVVEFDEQMRMAEDPEYAAAVQRLRVRACTQEDADLFNTCVMKSDENPDGISVGSPHYLNGCIITKMNAARSVINNAKSAAQTSTGIDSLVVSAAQHLADGKEVDSESQAKLLSYDNFSSEVDVLPAFVPLYVGMPVIYRGRNLSTDLRIVKGSQGIVRHIEQSIASNGTLTVDCVLVEFPGSLAELDDLPPCYYPIIPDKTTFPVKLTGVDGRQEAAKIVRIQLPIQPAFAVTGHSAQGKTLLVVFVDLREGKFHAYVAASRAKTRDGLGITHPVKLEHLNKPLSSELRFELARLDVLAHNTLILEGFADGELIEVPDPEWEKCNLRKESYSISIAEDKPAAKKKRSANHDDKMTQPLCKKAKKSGGPTSICDSKLYVAPVLNATVQIRAETTRGIQGPEWDASNWSCAYDSVLMHLLVSKSADSSSWWSSFTNSNSHILHLSSSLPSNCAPRLLLHRDWRDTWRNYLTSVDAIRFPRFGPIPISVDSLIDQLNVPIQPSSHSGSPHCTCTFGYFLCHTTLWTSRAPMLGVRGGFSINAQSASINTWLRLSLLTGTSSLHHSNCDNPNNTTDLPLSLVCSVAEKSVRPRVLPSLKVQLGDHDYHLRTIIYHGSNHFSSKFLDASGLIWKYDGMRNGGRAELLEPVAGNESSLLSNEGKDPLFYIFNRST